MKLEALDEVFEEQYENENEDFLNFWNATVATGMTGHFRIWC